MRTVDRLRNLRAQSASKQPFPKIPKVREYVQLKLTDGNVLTGYVFVDATSRIQDLLNSSTQFIPFIDENESILLINKSAIVQVRPFDT